MQMVCEVENEQLLLRRAGGAGEGGSGKEGESRNGMGDGLWWFRGGWEEEKTQLADVQLTKNRFRSALNLQSKPGDGVSFTRPWCTSVRMDGVTRSSAWRDRKERILDSTRRWPAPESPLLAGDKTTEESSRESSMVSWWGRE